MKNEKGTLFVKLTNLTRVVFTELDTAKVVPTRWASTPGGKWEKGG
jgi:hypothetical protein